MAALLISISLFVYDKRTYAHIQTVTRTHVHTIHTHILCFCTHVTYKSQCPTAFPRRTHKTGEGGPGSRIHAWSVWILWCEISLVYIIMLIMSQPTVLSVLPDAALVLAHTGNSALNSVNQDWLTTVLHAFFLRVGAAQAVSYEGVGERDIVSLRN